MAERDTQQVIDDQLRQSGIEEEAPKGRKEDPVSYKMVGDSKIPTSSQNGKLWQSRRDSGLSKRRTKYMDVAWRECIAYYNNHQVPMRMGTDGDWAGNDHATAKMTRTFTNTENIVFANTAAIVPAVYAKNPNVEFTTSSAEEEDLPVDPRTLEMLVDNVISKRSAPGVNLKPIMRRAVVHSTLTNISYVACGFTKREASSEQAYDDLVKISEELASTKDEARIRELEGQLMAIERRYDFLKPAGPWCKFLRSDQLVRDPDALSADFSDDKWIMWHEYMSTDWIKAEFATPHNAGDEPSQTEYRSIYEPTHVMMLNTSGTHNKSSTAPDEIFAFSLHEDDKDGDYRYYGYETDNDYRKALRTKVWMVWDRITRRVYMFNDKDWTWPIWVWDDPYNLEGFFPVAELSFYTDPEEGTGKSEVMYYLDQQDELNKINTEMALARQWARRNIFYDKGKIDRTDVEKLIKGDEDTIIGVNVPEGYKLDDFIKAMLPPSMEFVQLFDKEPIIQAIDRVSSVREVQRGAEFKTNTTNGAIAEYNSGTESQLDEKRDAVEDTIGRLGWMIAQMCLQFMDQDTVSKFVGPQRAKQWVNVGPDQISSMYRMQIVGGSTIKPTSAAQKQMAIQIGQVLGQFAQASPAIVMVVLRVLNRAFNEIVIKDEDWEMIFQAIGAPETNTDAPQGPSDTAGAGGDLGSQLLQLDPQQQQAVGIAMARGVPIQEAVPRVLQESQAA